VEQFVRDSRINQVYEGANGVQAMDLVGRKLGAHGGRAVQALFALIDAECAGAQASDDATVAGVAAALARANGELKIATMWLAQHGMVDPEAAGAGAYPYMEIMGIVALGLMWLRMAVAARKALTAAAAEPAFYEAKLVTARFFAERVMPQAGALRRELEAGAEAIMALPAEAFAVS
jgi:hypothetical protein